MKYYAHAVSVLATCGAVPANAQDYHSQMCDRARWSGQKRNAALPRVRSAREAERAKRPPRPHLTHRIDWVFT